MPTPYNIPVGDPQEGEPYGEPEEDFTICPDCGEDLPHHACRTEESDPSDEDLPF